MDILHIFDDCTPVLCLDKSSRFNEYAAQWLQQALDTFRNAESLFQYVRDKTLASQIGDIGLACQDFSLVRITRPHLLHIKAAAKPGKRSQMLALVIALILDDSSKCSLLIKCARKQSDILSEKHLWDVFHIVKTKYAALDLVGLAAKQLGTCVDIRNVVDSAKTVKMLHNDDTVHMGTIGGKILVLRLQKDTILHRHAGSLLQEAVQRYEKAERLFKLQHVVVGCETLVGRLTHPEFQHVVAGGETKRSIMVSLVISLMMFKSVSSVALHDHFCKVFGASLANQLKHMYEKASEIIVVPRPRSPATPPPAEVLLRYGSLSCPRPPSTPPPRPPSTPPPSKLEHQPHLEDASQPKITATEALHCRGERSRSRRSRSRMKVSQPKETWRVDVSEVRYNQDSISSHFRDGRPLNELVSDLNSGRQQPLDMPPLRIIDWPGRGLFTLDHRRLWCLKQHQLVVSHNVQINAEVYRLPVEFHQIYQSHPIMEEFMWKYCTRNSGQSVSIGFRSRHQRARIFNEVEPHDAQLVAEIMQRCLDQLS